MRACGPRAPWRGGRDRAKLDTCTPVGERADPMSNPSDFTSTTVAAHVNSATIVGRPPVAMVADGACLRGTLENLAAGWGTKPLSEGSIAKARRDALGLLEDVLEAYEKNVARGEVGAGASGRAGEAAPINGRCPTGLLYGRIQSGKTVAMIAFTAAALDNGFRVAVVLTSDYVKLVEQTARRFGALWGPLVKDSTRVDTWERDAAHMKEQIAEHGLVVVCAKNQAHLAKLV